MREIQASEAKVHLPQLLDEVERARIVTDVDCHQEEIDKALQGIREIRKHTGRVTVAELLSARDEGRKL